MDSYLHLTGTPIRVGARSPMNGGNAPLRMILDSIDSEGTAVISFHPLSEAVYQEKTGIFDSPVRPNGECYLVDIGDTITVYYTSPLSRLYGLYAIRRNYTAAGIPRGVIYNVPKFPYRSYRAYLPGREGLEELKSVIDFLIAFGHNSIMLEISGAMEYKRHPEINEGWVDYCAQLREYEEKPEDSMRISPFPKNSVHIACGAGGYLTQDEVRTIVDYCRERDFEIIPEVPSLSHAAYLLYNHPEFSEYPGDPLPNNACPSHAGYKALVRDVLDEVIEVFQPKRINICHDEAYVYGQCPLCREKEPARLFADDVIGLYEYLAARGIGTMMWGDKITPTGHGGFAAVHRRFPANGRYVIVDGKAYDVHPFKCLSMEEWEAVRNEEPDAEGWYVAPTLEAVDMLPKDIEILNWCWSLGTHLDGYYAKHGYTAYFGNADAASIADFEVRLRNGHAGLSFSNWNQVGFDTTQMVSGLFHLGYNAFAAWTPLYDETRMRENVFAVAEAVYQWMQYSTMCGSYLEIIHTTPAVLEHPNFHYEHVYDPAAFRLGRYEIVYTDGTTESWDVIWGLHIGRSDVYWPESTHDAALETNPALSARTQYRYEPIGRSCPFVCGEETRYRMCVPIRGRMESVRYIAETEHEVILYSAEEKFGL